MFRRKTRGVFQAAQDVVNEVIPLEPRLLMSTVLKSAPKAAVKKVIVPVLTLNDLQVTEPKKGTLTASVVATLSQATTATVSFNYSTSGITATANKDFKTTSGSVKFKAGTKSATIKMSILSDKLKEPDEVFDINLSKISGATAARPFSRVVIRDINPENRPTASVTSGNVVDGSSAPFTITLSSPATAPVSFRYTTTAGSASTSQFRAMTGIVNIGVGQSSTIVAIPTTAGTVNSGTATFNLTLSSPSNANLGISSATATIVPATSVTDNSGGTTSAGSATISINDTSAQEGNSPGANSLVFTVTLSSAPVVPVTVQYFTGVDSTDPLHATPGVDYTDVSGTITFQVGQTTQTISVPIIGNTTQQGNRDVLMTLADPTSATFFRSQAVGTIIDDDTTQQIVPSQADFNGDGHPDILFRDVVTGAMTVWFMDGTTRLGTATLNTPNTNLQDEAIGTGDFDRDGHPDIVFKNTSTGAVTIWAQTGTNSLTTQHIYTVEASSDVHYQGAAVGDFNNDGNPDILFRNALQGVTTDNPNGSTDGGKNMVWVMSGFTHVSTQFLPQEPDNSFKVAGVGDYNGDGNLDVYFHNSSTGDNSVWLLDGNFNRTSIVALGNSGADTTVTVVPRAVESLTGGSSPDILLRNANTGENDVWLDSNSSLVVSLPADTDLNDQIVGSQTL